MFALISPQLSISKLVYKTLMDQVHFKVWKKPSILKAIIGKASLGARSN